MILVIVAYKAPRITGSWFLTVSIPTQWRIVSKYFSVDKSIVAPHGDQGLSTSFSESSEIVFSSFKWCGSIIEMFLNESII